MPLQAPLFGNSALLIENETHPVRGDSVKLCDLLAGVPLTGGEVNLDMEISSISYDSRTLCPGALFVALPGEKTDGHRYIDDALEKGAAAVLFFGMPYAAGTLIFILVCAVILLRGMRAIETVSVILVPFLMAGIMLIASGAEGEALAVTPKGGSVYISAVIYVSYNVIAAPCIIIDSERSGGLWEDLLTGLLCGAAMTGMGIVAGRGILSVPGATGSEFPLAVVAGASGKGPGLLYMGVFLTAVLTTAVCNGLAASDFARENMTADTKKIMLFMLISAFPISFVRLVTARKAITESVPLWK